MNTEIGRIIGGAEASELFAETSSVLQWAKLIGAIAGSLISVAYILPRTRREAALRMCVGLVTGLVFGGAVGVQMANVLGLLGKVSAFEIALSGAALSSLSAWWSLGALNRVVERWPRGVVKNIEQEKTGKDDAK